MKRLVIVKDWNYQNNSSKSNFRMISGSKMFREPPKIWNPYLQRNDINPEFAQLVTPAFEMLQFSNAEMQNMKQNLKNSI